MRIYLTGFMASGKSTIGPILSNVLGLDFYDLDQEIEEFEKSTIVEIFEKKGEPYFRNLESEILKKLTQKDNVVISLGGGTITFPDNYELMKNTGKIIYLKVSPEEIYKRLKNKTDRPLLREFVLGEASKEEFMKRINELLEKRKPFYEKADLIVDTSSNPIGVTIDTIAKKILRLFNEKD
ncbi:shikimate kinase [Rosettibacter firmus]|uniref:shikimate kinase n=1 Tax=Rosettibacter firmus TaxID=3111522 RepID=UPI00336C18E9